jgi:hypothetical protein
MDMPGGTQGAGKLKRGVDGGGIQKARVGAPLLRAESRRWKRSLRADHAKQRPPYPADIEERAIGPGEY